MKHAHATKARSRNRQTAGVSLFPFLAVLMCTMGSLVLLLIVISRQSRLQAAEAARAVRGESAEKKEDLEAARELVQLQISQLQASRQQTESQLAESRLQLGHLEDHLRRLRQQLAELQNAYAELEKVKSAGGQERQALEGELERVNLAIVDAQKRLTDAQQAAKQREKCYAIVPYEGPNQTHRRPIYLECREDSVILQPEGIRFAASDFDGPLGPGNPLDAALRATREHLLAKQSIAPDGSGEPYPLLLVRPDGIPAYYAARAAMKSWSSEFGYELVGADWQLKFQQPDPQLADIVNQTVKTARLNQQRLAQVAPRHYSNSSSQSRPVYRAAPNRGGVVLDGGPVPEDDNDLSLRPRYPTRPLGRASVSPSGGASGSATGSQEGAAEATDRASVARGTSSSPPQTPQRPSQQQQQEQQPKPGQTAVALRPGEWIPYERPPKEKPDEEAKDKKKLPEDEPQRADRQVRSLAETRGVNWGLPKSSPKSVAVTRPIRVECHPDQLVLPPEWGQREGKEIPLQTSTETSVDEFVSAVWDRMDSWGIAGRNTYWRPILKVHLAPGAEQRFRELQTLLDGSGLDVQAAEAQ